MIRVTLSPTGKMRLGFFLTASSSAIIGATTAYLVLRDRLEARYAALAEEEINQAKSFYNRLNKQAEFSDPIEVLKNYGSFVEEMNSEVDEDIPEDAEISEEYEDFDYDKEIANRDRNHPYVITHDEFFTNETDYIQTSLTYYEEDDVLTETEDDSVIDDTERTVGNDNLLKFGHGSKDNNVVYVRNDVMETDFEILRSKGNYAREVLGFIEHSDSRSRPRKFRSDYE